MRKLLLLTSALVASTPALAQSVQTASLGGMTYFLLPAAGGCSAAAPCSVVTYLSVQSESQGATEQDLTNYFGGAFQQANPHTIVIAPVENGPQDATTNWGGYNTATTPEQAQMVAIVQSVEQQMGNTVNPKDSVVTGGSLGGTGTQAALVSYGPKGQVQAGVFSAGLSFDAADWMAASDPSEVAALCGVPLMAVHGTADTNQSISYDQNLQSTIDGNSACSNSFTLDPIQGAGHGTWSGPDGYEAGTGSGTPLGWLTTEIQGLSTDPPATATAATPPSTDPPATTPAATTATPSATTATPSATATTTPVPQNNLTIADDEIVTAEAIVGQPNPNMTLVDALLADAQAQLAAPTASTSTSPATTPANTTPGAAAIITPGQGSVTDCQGNVWTINANNKILENGTAVVGGGDTSKLTMSGCTVYGLSNGQNGSSTNWFTMNSASPTTKDGWTVASAPPINASPAAPAPTPAPTTITPTPAPTPTPTPSPTLPVSVCNGTTAAGGFTTKNGQIYGPNGQLFIAAGINEQPGQLATVQQLQSDFPGINFVRFASDYATSDMTQENAEITALTQAGIVVDLEDHPWPSPGVYSGAQLQAETAWYAQEAAYFKNNPYVWFGTMNEPSGSSPAGIQPQEDAIYQAVRGAGNNSMVLLELYGGGDPGTIGVPGGMVQGDGTSSMTNVAWDLHFYGWSTNYSTDPGTLAQAIISDVQQAQTITGPNGATIPVVIGEFGNSTDGQNMDPDGSQVVSAVINSGYGFAAWQWGASGGDVDNLADGSGNLSDYGQQVAAGIAANGKVAAQCAPPATAAAATPATAPAPATPGTATTQANTLPSTPTTGGSSVTPVNSLSAISAPGG